MDDKKRDRIIKIILIIIIIILLLHNCSLLKKKGKDKTPSGNVNIIEITCEDDNKCDIESDDNNKSNDSDKKDDNNDVDTTSDNTNTTNNNGNKKNNNSTSNNSGNGSSNNSSGTSNNSSSDDSGDDDVEEPDNEMFVRDNRLVWNDTSELKIFTNSVYTFEDKIAPESSNTYQFVVKNSTSYKLNYNISFIETNPYHINMKYKLKKNDSYIVDHYVSYNELNVSDQLINAKTNDTFYLEWKWVSADNDNEAGENAASYSLSIKVEAESV